MLIFLWFSLNVIVLQFAQTSLLMCCIFLPPPPFDLLTHHRRLVMAIPSNHLLLYSTPTT